jgi:hypothetical protein
MPRATANVNETEKHELKTCPDGWIEVRRLTYGEKLERRAMTSGMTVEAGKGKDFKGEMQLVNEQATLYDFQRCIVDHNLEDENGNKLKLGSIVDIKRLDPRIGEEIDEYLGKLNNFDEDEESSGN